MKKRSPSLNGFFHDTDSPKMRDRITKAVAFSDEVQQEDIPALRKRAERFESSTYDRGRYSVKRENGVHHFHMLLATFWSGETDVPIAQERTRKCFMPFARSISRSAQTLGSAFRRDVRCGEASIS